MDDVTLTRAHRIMLTSRAIDDWCAAYLARGGVVPNYHSGRGQEALAAGTGLAAPHDYVLYGYRDYGTLLAKGVSLEAIAGDLLLKPSGTTEGYGGIMHVTSPEHGFVGRNSVFGSRFGIAAGLGLSASRAGDGRVVVCAYGEAEGGRGGIYEALNFACLQRLPIVFVAQNNGFSITSRTADLYAGGSMSALWRGMPMPVSVVDGNDVRAVHAAVRHGAGAAAAGLGPCLIEALTFRVDGHIPAEATVLGVSDYRSAEETERWRRRDPIEAVERVIRDGGIASDAELAAVRAEAAALVAATFERAVVEPDPEPATIHRHVYQESESTHV